MPYCHNCKIEYVEGVKQCADCGSLLFSLPAEKEKKELLQCENCDNNVTEKDSYCPSCGAVFEDGVFCEKHPKKEALSRCMICNTYLCEECLTEIDKRAFCPEHREYSSPGSSSDLVIIRHCETYEELSLIKSLLDSEGIGYFVRGEYEANRHYPYEIEVKWADALEAINLIDSRNDGEDPAEKDVPPAENNAQEDDEISGSIVGQEYDFSDVEIDALMRRWYYLKEIHTPDAVKEMDRELGQRGIDTGEVSERNIGTYIKIPAEGEFCCPRCKSTQIFEHEISLDPYINYPEKYNGPATVWAGDYICRFCYHLFKK